MKVIKRSISLLAILFVLAVVKCFAIQQQQTQPQAQAQAQSPQKPEDLSILRTGSVASKFDFIMTKSNPYQEYRVVKTTWLHTLRSHVLDSLNAVKKNLQETQVLAKAKSDEIDSLKSHLQNTNSNLASVSKHKNSISFLGISLEKSTYNKLIWTFIALLSVSLFIFIFLYKKSSSIISGTKQSLEETKEEFEAFRKRALEREGSLARKYLDELNKFKNKVP